MERGPDLEHFVCLVRHGAATSASENPARPLSPRGRVHAERSASWLAAVGLPVAALRHSGKLRARETAEIFARHLGLNGGRVREVPGLTPDDPVEHLAVELEAERETVVLVGHLPHLGRLASHLLVNDPDRLPLQLSPGGIVLLSCGVEGWRLVGLTAPTLLPV